MSQVVISVENLSKQYRLGSIGGRTFRQDAARWWAKKRGRPDPYLRLGQTDYANQEGETVWALRDINLQVHEGEIVGIIGRNGAGKSTLLKILSRITAPTAGQVKIKGRIGSLLEVGTGFHPELTGRENVYLNGAILGMTRAEVDRKFDEIVDFSGVEQYIDTPVKRYSSGMQVRLAFAVAAHLEPEILLIDEVLAVGDIEFQRKCLGKMSDVASGGRTILFVSHNMDAVARLCHEAVVLADGKVAFQAPVKEAVSAYEDLTLGRVERSYSTSSASVLYESEPEAGNEFQITRVEMLGPDGNPKTSVCTWDYVVFRIHYHAGRKVRHGSVVLQFSTPAGTPLLLLSTQPDSTVPMEIVDGTGFADCAIEEFPLAAGSYLVGCGLAIPRHEWLYWNSELLLLTIGARDVYSSGLPPDSHRSLIATRHLWRTN